MVPSRSGWVVAGPLMLLASGCASPERASRPDETLGGVVIAGEVLQRGERTYRAVCSSCHGVAGDGRGRLGVRQDPKPRSFEQGVIKFASVPAGQLWTDADLLRTLRHGLRGTQMFAIRVPEDDLRAVAHYIKRFSSRWRNEVAGTPVAVTIDPWAEPEEAAVAGEPLYARLCGGCHEQERSIPSVWDAPVRAPKLEGYQAKVGAEPDQLYRTLAAGVGGLSGKEGLDSRHTPKEIWSLVHYLRVRLGVH